MRPSRVMSGPRANHASLSAEPRQPPPPTPMPPSPPPRPPTPPAARLRGKEGGRAGSRPTCCWPWPAASAATGWFGSGERACGRRLNGSPAGDEGCCQCSLRSGSGSTHAVWPRQWRELRSCAMQAGTRQACTSQMRSAVDACRAAQGRLGRTRRSRHTHTMATPMSQPDGPAEGTWEQ